jgi:hypothetical protein
LAQVKKHSQQKGSNWKLPYHDGDSNLALAFAYAVKFALFSLRSRDALFIGLSDCSILGAVGNSQLNNAF